MHLRSPLMEIITRVRGVIPRPLKHRDNRSGKPIIPLVAGAVVIALLLTLYLLTLDDGLRPDELMGGDLITHQYAQAQARFANAPGYPLYTMLGWLWFHLGKRLLGWAFNPIQVLSLYSTFWAIAALTVFFLLSIEMIPNRWPLALWAVAYYGVTYFFWYYAVTTEQYTSAVFQTVLLLWLAFRWWREKKAGGPYTASPGSTVSAHRAQGTLLWMAFIAGTCAANLVTTLLIVPPLVAFILWEEPSLLRKPRLILKAALLALLPLLSYAYVYIRGAQHPEWRGVGEWPSTLAWFLEFLTAPQGRSEMSWTLWPPGGNYPWLAFWELSWPVFVAGLAGWAFLGKKKASLFYGTAVLYFAFCYIDRFGNWYQVIMPLYPLIILGAVVAADRLLTRYPHKGIKMTLAIALMSLLLWRFASNYPKADQSNRPEATGLEPGWTILADFPPDGSCIAGTYEENLALQYLSIIWGVRPQVKPISVEEAIRSSLADKPCYITRRALDIAPALYEQGLHPASAGATLIRLNPQPLWELPSELCRRECVPVHDTEKGLAGEIKLVGYAYLREPEALRVTLFWQAVKPLERDYTVSVRPMYREHLIPAAKGFIQQDHRPVWGAYPTSRWIPGEIVRDDYHFTLQESIDTDGLQIVVYFVEKGVITDLGEVELRILQ